MLCLKKSCRCRVACEKPSWGIPMATINNATTRLPARIMAIDKKPFTALFLVHPVHRSLQKRMPWGKGEVCHLSLANCYFG
jgi:hypothetical protein